MSLLLYHLLHGSSSRVLTAIGQVNGSGRFLTFTVIMSTTKNDVSDYAFLPSLGGGRKNFHTASAEAHLKASPLRNPTPY